MHLVQNDIQIRERAYSIWEREGRPEGREWDHWMRAMNEMRGEHGASAISVSQTRSAKPAVGAKAAGHEKPATKARRGGRSARG